MLLPVVAAVACSDSERPPDHVFAQTTALVQYETCDDLEADLKDILIRDTWAEIDRHGTRRLWLEDASGSPGDGGGRQEGVDFSGTNNQESGVDEADFVKTDGYHIYALNGNRLHIFGVPQFGALTPTSVTKLEGHPRQMLLHRDANRVAVFSSIDVATLPLDHPLREALGITTNDRHSWRTPAVSKITVLDITDRGAPGLVREVYYEGYYNTARRIDSTIRVAGYGWISPPGLWDWYEHFETGSRSKAKAFVADYVHGLQLADLIPQLFVRTPDGRLTSDSLGTASCRSFFRPTDSHARGIASIMSLDLLGESLRWDADHVVSNYPMFYASTDQIVIAEQAHDWWWYWWFDGDPDQLNLHAFDVSTPGQAAYIGSGRVTGRLSDQFALDEHAGAIRVATTTDLAWRWWTEDGDDRPEPENHVWVLERGPTSLQTIGHLGGIAKGERITATRFLDDRAFLVTARQIDPLFTIDLGKRDEPRLVGELKVPGFSTYLHPVDDATLLSIGVGGDENGVNWRTTISLFDVSDFANPAQTAAVSLAGESGWGWSEALWEHKAFQYWAPKKLLAVPQATYRNDGRYHYISRLELIGVDPGVGLTRRGAIDHSAYYNVDPFRFWSFVDIRRSIFMGDYIYAISDKAITAHRTSDLGLVAEQRLPGYDPNDWYWWW